MGLIMFFNGKGTVIRQIYIICFFFGFLFSDFFWLNSRGMEKSVPLGFTWWTKTSRQVINELILIYHNLKKDTF